MRHYIASLVLILAATAPAQAQLGLPAVPSLPLGVDRPLQRALDGVDRQLADLRQLRLQALLREHRDVLDTDPRGALIVRGQVIAIDPSEAALVRARSEGFRIVRDATHHSLGLRVVVLEASDARRTRHALKRLQKLDRQGQYDYNHLYTGSGATTATAPQGGVGRDALRPLRIGLIDSGVDATHTALEGVRVERFGCDGVPHPHAHGTAVASLLIGAAATPAPAPATLLAADIYCGRPTGGAVEGLVEALAWMAREQVPVINISLVGPPNALLERAVTAMGQRGHVLVAAVGNDGPAAPPLYPAAYAPVIGVTATDRRQRALPEAGRGAHVDFAAPGGGLQAAGLDGGWQRVRGTSFAAPLVARQAALALAAGTAVPALRRHLAAEAADLGRRGRDHTYGEGLLGHDLGLAWAEPPR